MCTSYRARKGCVTCRNNDGADAETPAISPRTILSIHRARHMARLQDVLPDLASQRAIPAEYDRFSQLSAPTVKVSTDLRSCSDDSQSSQYTAVDGVVETLDAALTPDGAKMGQSCKQSKSLSPTQYADIYLPGLRAELRTPRTCHHRHLAVARRARYSSC